MSAQKKESAREGAEKIYLNIAKRAGKSESVARRFVEALLEETADALAEEERIALPGIGIFKKKFSEKRDGVNPATGKKMKIQAHNRLAFTPARALSDAVNAKYRHLKPNVLDEMKAMTGLRNRTEEEKKAKDKAGYRKARKRALISLGILGLLLALLAALILIPVFFRGSDNRAVEYVRKLNTMMGLETVSRDIAHSLDGKLNEEMLARYIIETKKQLSVNRKIVAHHTVHRGDTIYSIAKRHWGNRYLWPDLYYLNRDRFEDPDLIHIGETINIYEKLGDPGTMPEEKRRELVEAYITMYRVSRALGEKEIKEGKRSKGEERIRESRWTLYTALRYEHDLLDLYEKAIYPDDADIVEEYVDRFGYGDGNERGILGKFFRSLTH